MPDFNEATWRDKVTEKLQGWKARMNSLGADSVYGILAASAFWPVYQAMQTDPWGAGTVLGAVGGNLVANVIQKWKDEADAAKTIQVAAEENPELLRELDLIIKKFDVLSLAQNALPEEDHQWFRHTLSAELEKLGNAERYHAVLSGTGTIIQGNRNITATKGSLAAETITNSPVTIDNSKRRVSTETYVEKQEKHYHLPPDSGRKEAAEQARKQDQAALHNYLEYVFRQGKHLPLRGRHLKASDMERGGSGMELAEVYVGLQTTTLVKAESKPDEKAKDEQRYLTALEAVGSQPKSVLLGEPGSGKTTFVNHLCLCLAGHHLTPENGWLHRLPAWSAADLIPVRVVVRDFAQSVKTCREKPTPRHVWEYIAGRLKDENLDEASKPLKHLLGEGRVILIFDGLDEIPGKEQRNFVRQALKVFADRYKKARMLVTCRVRSYANEDRRLGVEFPIFTLGPFDQTMINSFISSWYAELLRIGELDSKDQAENLASGLQKAVKQKPDLRRMADNPLLLTVMSLVHTDQSKLPENRASLYNKAVEFLLYRWDQIKTGNDDSLSRFCTMLGEVGRKELDLKNRLAELAYRAQQEGGDDDGPADIPEHRLIKVLAGLHPEKSHDWAICLVGAMKGRAGLLLEREPGIYAFPHRTFQEYLAGFSLTTKLDFRDKVVDLTKDLAYWRQVILLAVGQLVHENGDTARPLELLSELCPIREPEDVQEWRCTILAGEIIEEIGTPGVKDGELGRELLKRVRHRLSDTMGKSPLPALERAEAGRILARLGDTRPEVLDPLRIEWCRVEPGWFTMGSNEERAKEYLLSAQPEHRIYLAEYQISRYPVTNAQYAVFVEAGGYGMKELWSEAIGAGYWENSTFKGIFDSEGRNQAEDFGEPFNLANHPVVGITWYEALAFSRWLHGQQRLAGKLPQGWVVRLPSEPEWEKAARGKDGRPYPWGKNFDSEYCNAKESTIGTSTAVGTFPKGASPWGAEDMAGNVWEWTVSVNGTYPYPEAGNEREKRENLEADSYTSRIIRGGGFSGDGRVVGCAVRLRYDPYLRFGYMGFRVLSSPSPLKSEPSEL